MKKPLRSLSRSNDRRTKDKQLIEFERADLGDDIRASSSGRILRKSVKPTSILLEQDLIERLREKGAKRGLGYQTMLKVIVREHLDDY
jgi:predicted DNA binding CopG/RHH family protein